MPTLTSVIFNGASAHVHAALSCVIINYVIISMHTRSGLVITTIHAIGSTMFAPSLFAVIYCALLAATEHADENEKRCQTYVVCAVASLVALICSAYAVVSLS